jgi:hypothetical protein
MAFGGQKGTGFEHIHIDHPGLIQRLQGLHGGAGSLAQGRDYVALRP